MKRILIILSCLTITGLFSGCASARYGASSSETAMMTASADAETADQGRMLIWNASLSVEVKSVSNAVTRATATARQSGGYVESKSDSGDTRARLTLRLPVESLTATLGSLEALGKVLNRHIASDDVTEQYVDIDARLKTKTALRDKLRHLLDKAQDVKDILAIEKELERVQADIDSMQARLKTLKGQVDLATVHLSLERKRILGPVGFVLKGAWWAVEKLFVIRK